MNKGKKIENDVKKYLKDNNIFFHKFTDSYASRGMSQPVPSDFIIWPKNGPSILLECKESQVPRIPLTAFRPSQFKAMRESLKCHNVNYYVLICYNKEYYLMGAKVIIDCLDLDVKVINLDDGFLPISPIDIAIRLLFDDNNDTL